jgi:ubiquinone/menaquinone biosynthesis C-methylase UbiE
MTQKNMDTLEEINLLENVYEFIIPKYHEINDMIVSLLDFDPGQEVRFVDLGVGLGALSDKALEAFPLATVFGIDSNKDILHRSSERLLAFKGQYVPLLSDLETIDWVNNLENINAVISSFTLDFLPLERHRDLLKEAFDLLLPNGRLISCEFFKAEDNLINRIFHDMEIRFVHRAMKDGLISQEQINQLSQISFLKKQHHVCTLESKIQWLRMAGFGKIEVPWKFLNLAIVSAVRE